jgi:hypothetical protein
MPQATINMTMVRILLPKFVMPILAEIAVIEAKKADNKA